ncbi:MAG: VTT domain-containing protein [Alsobacter sp.]
MADRRSSEMREPAVPQARRRPDAHWLALAVLLILAGTMFWAFHRYVSADDVLAHYDLLRGAVERNVLLALAGYILVYILIVCLSMPGSVMMTAVGGLLFGWKLGAIAAAFAAGTGAIGVFLLARSAIGPLLVRDAGPRMARIAKGLQADAASYLLFVRFTPVIPFFLINVAAALFGVPLRTFAWCTYLGILPAAFALAAAGSALDGVMAAQKDVIAACKAAGGEVCAADLSFSRLLTPGMLCAMAALGLLALTPVLSKRLGLFGARTPDGKD